MKRRMRLQVLAVLSVSILCMLVFGGVAHAQSGGGVGSGGGGGGTSSTGHYSKYGWGWRVYSLSSGGPSDGFRSGSWGNVLSACTGYSTQALVFVIDDAVGTQMGYDYHTVYYSPATFGGYRTASPYMSVPSAKAAYDALTVDKSGFTWGVNVGWFCYGAIPPTDVCPNLAGAQATVPPGYIKDGAGNCVIPDRAPTINVDTINCIAATISGVAIDGDWSGEIDVHIYVGGAAGSGASRYVRRTSGHRFTFVDPNPNPMRISGQRYYLYAIGVNSSGAANGTNVAFGGNPVSMGPCNSATCTIDTFPAQMLVGDGNQFTVSMQVSYWGAPLVVGNPALTVQVRDPNGVITTSTPSYTVSGSSPATLTSNPISFNSNIPGTYQMQWSLVGNGLNTLCPGGNNGSWSNPRIGNAGYRPYFDVVGGDILANGDIRSWNDDGTGGSYAGGGTQLAALATGSVQNFITGSGLSSGYFASGHGLGFANTGAGGSTYGGGYTVTPFVPEIPAQTNTLSGAVDLSTLAADGVYYATSSISLYGTLATGRQVTIYVTTGSAYISGAITYGSYGANTSDIPRLTVIVEDGNISVARTVNVMRGIFIAKGTGVNGNFHSCASAVDTPITSTTPNAYALCNSPLVVYGAVAANRLVLGRTYGTYRANATGVPVGSAEQFYYSPELWLAPDGTGSASLVQDRYDSFVSLPPVL